MFNGIAVTLLKIKREGNTASWTSTVVENVLVAPFSEGDAGRTSLLIESGHRAVYHLAIPKDDENTWEGQLVQFFGQTWAVVGIPTKGIDKLIPGPWNLKVVVELYRTGAPSLDSLWTDQVELISVDAAKDSAGYDVPGDPQRRKVVAIFTSGIDAALFELDQKEGARHSATVELWENDYHGELQLSHGSLLYEVAESKTTGRGTVLLKLMEVWR